MKSLLALFLAFLLCVTSAVAQPATQKIDPEAVLKMLPDKTVEEGRTAFKDGTLLVSEMLMRLVPDQPVDEQFLNFGWSSNDTGWRRRAVYNQLLGNGPVVYWAFSGLGMPMARAFMAISPNTRKLLISVRPGLTVPVTHQMVEDFQYMTRVNDMNTVEGLTYCPEDAFQKSKTCSDGKDLKLTKLGEATAKIPPGNAREAFWFLVRRAKVHGVVMAEVLRADMLALAGGSSSP